MAQKEQEIQLLKGGIQILSRAIEEKVEGNEWLTVYAKGLSLLDDYDHVLENYNFSDFSYCSRKCFIWIH